MSLSFSGQPSSRGKIPVDQKTYQSPVLPSRSMGFPSSKVSAQRNGSIRDDAWARNQSRRDSVAGEICIHELKTEHTLAGRDHVIVVVFSHRRETDVRHRPRMSVAGEWHILARF